MPLLRLTAPDLQYENKLRPPPPPAFLAFPKSRHVAESEWLEYVSCFLIGDTPPC
jgi:hypothetical protein